MVVAVVSVVMFFFYRSERANLFKWVQSGLSYENGFDNNYSSNLVEEIVY